MVFLAGKKVALAEAGPLAWGGNGKDGPVGSMVWGQQADRSASAAPVFASPARYGWYRCARQGGARASS
ncbi:MAG: hypothetical protein WA908_01615 [Pontixanthobacter sp.]